MFRLTISMYMLGECFVMAVWRSGYRSICQLTNSVTRRFGDKAGRFGERLGRFGNTIGRFVDNFTNSVTGGSEAIVHLYAVV